MSTRTYPTAATRGSTTSCPRVSAGRKSQRAAAASQPRADTSPSYRGAAAAGYVSGESRIRRGWKCLRRIAAPPRPRRVYVSGKSRRRRGWICYGESRRRRSRAQIRLHRIAAPPRLDMSPANRGSAAVGNVSGESRRRRGRDAYTSPANRGAAAAATRIRLRRIAASPRLDTSSVAALRPCARWRGLPAAHEAAKFLGPRDQRRRGFRTQALRCSGTPSRLNQSGRNIRTSSLEESRFFFVLSQELLRTHFYY